MADSHSIENTCVVCFKNVLYYSIGECDHPVCFECSTRMRVLCLQNECPICRQDLARVVFTSTIQPYKELRNIVFTDRLFDRQFKIGYCTEEIKQAYDHLLENRCKLCEKIPPFRNFGMLSDHMRKVHERHFCDLCVKHLRIFTSERKCYTRQELAHHRRKGDLDDTSHRGHPLCEFCEERFMDADELYRHLRKEHLYCHLCDADGRNLYYASHAALAHHFRTDHYLCEEGECAGQHLTAVFRSDIDLKAHKATVHGRGMARGAARQARTLELQFNITPHPVAQRTPRERERVESPSPPPAVVAAIDTRSDAHFPRLSAAPPAHNLMLTPAHKGYRGGGGLARTDKNFPALDGAGRPPPTGPPPTTVAATILRNSKPSVSIQLQNQGASASSFRLTQTGANSHISHPAAPARRHPPPDPDDYPDDFPSLSARDDHPSIGAAATQPPKVAMINSQEMQSLKGGQTSSQKKKPQLNAEAFPALSAGAAPSAPPQWITVPRARDKRAPKQPPPAAPAPTAPAFPPRADFPTLPPNTKAKKAAPAPVLPAPRQPLTQPNDNSKPTKKEKKKQNNKKENQATIETNHWNGSANTKNLRDLYMNADINIENGESVEVDKKIKTVESPPSAVSERSRNGGTGDFALASQDYPPLSAGKRGPHAAQDYPPLSESKRGPPAVGTVAPPPGFRARAAFDGMTFTNSAGQTFSAPVHAYIPPPDFEPRNRLLVRQFAEALGGAAAVEQFKVASRAFRDGCISASEFHGHCRAALGDSMDLVFPELVALLPDISKQQELALASGIALAVCHTCGQLLAPTDLAVHERAHWPELASR